MSAPLHRTVCQLTGEQRGPSRLFAAAGPEADARIAEFEALKAENAVLRDSDIGEVQQRNQELFEENGRLRARVSRLEAQLDEVRAARDTARAVGGVL